MQVVEQLFVNVAEVLALGEVVEIDAADFIDDLPHELAGFHVVVGILEHAFDNAGAAGMAAGGGKLLERGE